jgi:hypothetical protein
MSLVHEYALDEWLEKSPERRGPARDGIEAQRGLNDVWPGDVVDLRRLP